MPDRRRSHAQIERRFGRPVYDSWAIEATGDYCEDGHPMYWLGLGVHGHPPAVYTLTCAGAMRGVAEEALRRHEAHGA